MRPLCHESGFTLFEIVIAMAVLAVGSVGATALTLSMIRGNAISHNITTATTLAQDKLEDIKRLGFVAAVSSTEEYGSIANYSAYRRVTTVTGAPAVTPVTKTVTVVVSWRGSGTHKVILNTIIAQ